MGHLDNTRTALRCSILWCAAQMQNVFSYFLQLGQIRIADAKQDENPYNMLPIDKYNYI